MFNWVVKVVPQPPPAGEETTKPAPSNKEVKKTDGESSSEERSRVINWVAQSLSQSLTKAGLPQPDEKYREKFVEEVEHTEVFEVKTMPDYDPLPHIPVVEMESDDEDTTSINSAPQQVVNWIKQAMPQPAHLPGAIETSPRPRPKRSITTSLDKVMSPPPQSLSGISLDTDDKAAGMVGWFVSGLGLRMPKLVVTPRDEMAADVLQKASADMMVLEDVDSDNEGQLKPEASRSSTQQLRSVSSSGAATQPLLSVTSVRSAQAEPEEEEEPPAVEEEAEAPQKVSVDAGTDTGRWTPFIDSIKKEAEGVAMATMEERLLEERAEMARLAEDVARQAAERAVRELTEEASIKLSLGSRDLLEEEPDAELQEVPQEELIEEESRQIETTELQEVPQEELIEEESRQIETTEIERLTIEPPEEGSEEADGGAEADPCSVQSEPGGTVSSAIRFCTHRSHSEAKCLVAIVPVSELPPEPEPETVDPQEEEEEEAAAEPGPTLPSEPTDQDPEAEPADPTAGETEAEADPEPEPEVVTQQPQKADEASLAAATVSADAASATKEEERPGEVSCESSGSLSPAVNVEDVDSDHKRAAAAEVLTPQDPTANTLTVPGPLTGGRHSKTTDKE